MLHFWPCCHGLLHFRISSEAIWILIWIVIDYLFGHTVCLNHLMHNGTLLQKYKQFINNINYIQSTYEHNMVNIYVHLHLLGCKMESMKALRFVALLYSVIMNCWNGKNELAIWQYLMRVYLCFV